MAIKLLQLTSTGILCVFQAFCFASDDRVEYYLMFFCIHMLQKIPSSHGTISSTMCLYLFLYSDLYQNVGMVYTRCHAVSFTLIALLHTSWTWLNWLLPWLLLDSAELHIQTCDQRLHCRSTRVFALIHCMLLFANCLILARFDHVFASPFWTCLLKLWINPFACTCILSHLPVCTVCDTMGVFFFFLVCWSKKKKKIIFLLKTYNKEQFIMEHNFIQLLTQHLVELSSKISIFYQKWLYKQADWCVAKQ